MPAVHAEFENQSWDEHPVAEWDGGKVTRADVVQAATGDVTGTVTTAWVMCYVPDGTAHYTGLTRIEGSLAGRAGTFVVENTGDFDGTAASGTVHVVAGSGTGELAGLRGDGKFHAPHGPKATFVLDYTLDSAS